MGSSPVEVTRILFDKWYVPERSLYIATWRSISWSKLFMQMMAILSEILSIGIATNVSWRSTKQSRTSFSAKISLVFWHLDFDVMWDILSSTLVGLFLKQKDSLDNRSAFLFIHFLHYYNDLFCFHDNSTLLIIFSEVY